MWSWGYYRHQEILEVVMPKECHRASKFLNWLNPFPKISINPIHVQPSNPRSASYSTKHLPIANQHQQKPLRWEQRQPKLPNSRVNMSLSCSVSLWESNKNDFISTCLRGVYLSSKVLPAIGGIDRKNALFRWYGVQRKIRTTCINVWCTMQFKTCPNTSFYR